ncbi:MAG: hypothetical protein WC848_00340 [Parcubacteria group bacterium]
MDENYNLLDIEQVKKELSLKKLPCSKSKIGSVVLQCKKTVQALRGDKEAQEYLRNLSKERYWIAIPYETFIKNGVDSWEKVLQLMAENDKDTKTTEQKTPAKNTCEFAQLPSMLPECFKNTLNEIESCTKKWALSLFIESKKALCDVCPLKKELRECLADLTACQIEADRLRSELRLIRQQAVKALENSPE